MTCNTMLHSASVHPMPIASSVKMYKGARAACTRAAAATMVSVNKGNDTMTYVFCCTRSLCESFRRKAYQDNQQPRSNLDSLPCPDYLAVVCVRLCPIFINRGPATVLIHGHSPNRRKCQWAYQDIHVKRLGGSKCSDAWLYFQMNVCRARPSDMSRRLFYPFLLCPWLGTAQTVPGQLVRG
jgi:hypothetical protein